MQRQVYKMPKAGNMAALAIQNEKIDRPKGNEVQVQVKAIGLNFADIFAMQGLYSATPKGAFIPGLEFSGEVIGLGDDVTNFKLGDRVMGASKFGAYVSHINHPENYLSKVPEDWSYEEGAAFVVQGLTAYYALVELGNIKEDYTVLIHSAAGGVGIMANRICKKFNAFTIGTVGGSHKLDLLRKEGYNQAIVRSEEFAKDLKEAKNGRDLNLVLESIGGEIFMDSYKAMAPMGRLITFGSASFTPSGSKPNMLKLGLKYLKRPKLDVMKMPNSNKSVMGFNLIWLYDRIGTMKKILDDLLEMQLEPQHVGQVFDFDNLPEALRTFQSGNTMGKVVVKNG